MTDDDAYMTWDVKYGEFTRNDSTIDWAVSAPRADMLKGTGAGLTALGGREGGREGGGGREVVDDLG